MKFLTSVVLFSFGALAHSGWTIPKDHPSGVYNVVVDASGNSKHNLVRDLGASTQSAFRNALANAADLSKRGNIGINKVECFDYLLQTTDANAAVDNLKLQCAQGGFMEKKADYYAIDGKVVAYACNFSDGPNACYADEVEDALKNKVTAVCGSFIAGYDHVRVRGLRYGYEKKDAEFCDGRGIEGDD